jgi:hypothetical protein
MGLRFSCAASLARYSRQHRISVQNGYDLMPTKRRWLDGRAGWRRLDREITLPSFLPPER